MCLVPSTVLQLWGVEPHKKPKNKPSFLKVTHHNDSCLITFLQLQLNTQCFWIFKTFLINFPPCLRQHPVSSDAREHQTSVLFCFDKNTHVSFAFILSFYRAINITEPRVCVYMYTQSFDLMNAALRMFLWVILSFLIILFLCLPHLTWCNLLLFH